MALTGKVGPLRYRHLVAQQRLGGHHDQRLAERPQQLPPKQMVSIALREQPGWVTFSLDGRHAYPSTGEVIDTATKKVIATLADEKGGPVHSEKMVEIHLKDGSPTAVGDQFGLGRKK